MPLVQLSSANGIRVASSRTTGLGKNRRGITLSAWNASYALSLPSVLVNTHSPTFSLWPS